MRKLINQLDVDKLAFVALGNPVCKHGFRISRTACARCEEDFEKAAEKARKKGDAATQLLAEKKAKFIYNCRQMRLAALRISRLTTEIAALSILEV